MFVRCQCSKFKNIYIQYIQDIARKVHIDDFRDEEEMT